MAESETDKAAIPALNISGKSLVFGIIADPIGHVRGPTLMNRQFAAYGLDAVLVPFHVTPQDLPDFWYGIKTLRNFGGFLVTMPHKFQAAELCDSLMPMAERTGAVNIVRIDEEGDTTGAMFDQDGFVAGLKERKYNLTGKRALLLGAGGAATSLAHGLVDAGVKRLTIANRNYDRAKILAERLAESLDAAGTQLDGIDIVSGVPNTKEIDILINATSLGLKEDDPLPIAEEQLRPGMMVAEIIMQPVETKLLRTAKARGADIHYGEPMLRCQLPMMLEFWGLHGEE
ncbi:MAG: shikimate dehydrogenase [Alphaproteobacteria bacterium]|nr:shikimate dehydrogenase [Alphaproteobacteria bacterium]